MKLIVCFLTIFAYINHKSRASIDSFSPANAHILLADTTWTSDKSCHRPCKLNVKSRRCHYTFRIEPTIQEDGHPAITINGLSPGPPINVCANDFIVVEVTNKIPDQDITVHWHGIEHKGTPYMDGVPMITQCPISYGSTFKYAFIASTPGTFFYHSDSVSQQSDGVYGSLIVNQPQPFEPYSSLYDYDRSNEHSLIVAAQFPQLMTGNLEVNNLRPTSLVINGEHDAKLFMLPGYSYRLRLINAIALECPIVTSIEQHLMTVISSDGRPVKPTTAKEVKLYPGERMDVVVRALEGKGGYWINVRGEDACAGLNANAMFLASGYNYTAMLAERQNNINIDSDSTPVYGQMLESNQEMQIEKNVKSLYLGIDRNTVLFKDTDNDFRYYFDSLPSKPFFPVPLTLREAGVVQINNKSFLYPSVPVLLHGHRKSDNWCVYGEEENNKDPQCVFVLNAKEGEWLELALVNEGASSSESYTFHMHGYAMHVVATGRSLDGQALTRDKFLLMDKEGKIHRNLQRPVVKDTVTVPNKGFTIIMIRPNHGGSWLLECRSCSLSLPTALLINVPQALPKSVVDSMPKCGNYKPPDVLLT